MDEVTKYFRRNAKKKKKMKTSRGFCGWVARLPNFTVPSATSCQYLLLALPASARLNGCDSGGHERNRTAGAQRETEEGTQGGRGSVWAWIRKVSGESGGQNAGLKLSRVDTQLPGFNSLAVGCMLARNQSFCRLNEVIDFISL